MSERNETPKEVATINAPEWLDLVDDNDDSLDALKHHKRVSALKIIQGSSKSELKKKYGEGSVILPLAQTLVAEKEQKFLVMPFFFYDEYCVVSDYNDKDAPFILERTFDPTSEIARRCSSTSERVEEYEKVVKEETKKFKKKFTHFLNFMCIIQSEHIDPVEAVVSFKSGEFNQGRSWASAIQMRKVGGKKAPLFSQRWVFHSEDHSNPTHEWIGWGYSNPDPENGEGGPYVTKEEYIVHKAMFEEAKKAFAEKLIITDYDEEEKSDSIENEEL